MSRIVGIDFGSKRIGIAISDKRKKIAFPVGIIKREQNSYGLNKLKKMLEGMELDSFVVGLPLRTNGSRGKEVEAVEAYSRSLKDFFSKEVILWDERYTTTVAEQSLDPGGKKGRENKKIVDCIAAQLILQSFLDRLNINNSLN